MQHGSGFWISPAAEAVRVSSTHIRCVLAHPEFFRRERGELEQVYAQHDEKIGTEGAARLSIINELVTAGWIRIRHYLGVGEYVSVNLPNFGLDALSRVTAFFDGWGESDRNQYTPVRLSCDAGQQELTVAEICDGKLLDDQSQRRKLRWIGEVNIESKQESRSNS